MGAARDIGEAFAQARRDETEARMREQYRGAMRVLREIPSGTRDEDLTKEQREAWRLHDEALAYLQGMPF